MSFNSIKSTVKSAFRSVNNNIAESVAIANQKLQPVKNAAIELSEEANKLAGSTLFSTICLLNRAEENYPVVKSKTISTFLQIQGYYSQAVAFVGVLYATGLKLAKPWQELFTELNHFFSENSGPAYAQFKEGLINFYAERWGNEWEEKWVEPLKSTWTESSIFDDDENDLIEFINNGSTGQADSVAPTPPTVPSTTVAATKADGHSLTIVLDKAADDALSSPLPNTLRGLRKAAQTLGGITNYGHMSKDDLEQAVIKRINEVHQQTQV